MCREVVGEEEACLKDVRQLKPLLSNGHQEAEHREVIQLSDEIRVWQVKMARLLWKQKEKGGVIDATADHDVMDENWVGSKNCTCSLNLYYDTSQNT